ncbi:MAG: HAD family phosphatase [Clostridiales bacterium]|nr:HAD family phosphatase [Clostridiales bacterium]
MIFFDLDGTLLDSNRAWEDIDRTFLGRHGLAIPEGYVDYCAHHSFPDSAHYTRTHYLPHLTEEEIMAAWLELARDFYGHKLPLKPGACELLLKLHQQGEPMALLTSCMPQLCRAALDHHNLTEFFLGVLTTVETGLEKRDPAMYLHAAQMFHKRPEECTLVDDSPVYCAAARQAGWHAIGVRDDLFAHRREEFDAVCDRYLCDLTVF